jgi:DNA-binding MarR family transcriptional regulator
MKVHIVPHGRATIHVKRGLRDYASVDKVYLLTSDAFENEGVELESELAEFGYDVESHLIDAFDLRSVVDTIVGIAKEYPDDELFINITGGTNLVAGGATSSAFFIGATPYYVLEPQDDDEDLDDLVMELPAPTQPLTFEIEGLQRDVLVTLGKWDEQGRRGVIMREIGEELGESAQKISYHVNQLETRGLVEKRSAGRSKNTYLTDVGKLYLRWTGKE